MKTHCLTSLPARSYYYYQWPNPCFGKCYLFTLSPTFTFSRHRNSVQPSSRSTSQYRLYYRRKIFLPSTGIISGSQNFVARHTFVLELPVIPQISNTHLSALLFYFGNAPTTLRMWTLAPSIIKTDLGMKTEMNALNYIEFHFFQQDISTLWQYYYTRHQSSPYSSM